MPRKDGYKYDPKVNKKPGRKPNAEKFNELFHDHDIITHKLKLLELLSSGVCMNITAAARKLGLNPVRVRYWAEHDPDFKEMLRLAHEVYADTLEEKLATWTTGSGSTPIPIMMILKGLRQQYKDSYKPDINHSALEKILKELQEIAKRQQLEAEPSKPAISAPNTVTVEAVELPSMPAKVEEIIKS
jgi:hypothetical protein